MRRVKLLVSGLLVLALLAAAVWPALADQGRGDTLRLHQRDRLRDCTSVEAKVYAEKSLPPELVTAVEKLNLEQLRALDRLVHLRIKELKPTVEFSGEVSAVSGNTFTVTRGGKKGGQESKTFTLTSDTKIEAKGKGSATLERGQRVKVKATKEGKALEVRILPAAKFRAGGHGNSGAQVKVEVAR
ncbi:DUF5666 domain-containing protein [Ammonifex thiophilus]|uniref:DUF5666 domain-containing protein n=1 Tax=Ammonifex thiophilus TaxID=444093 RepID=UPI00106A0B21|nr:DUF5666 domain-containing protein [Ammonifex thiophilus]